MSSIADALVYAVSYINLKEESEGDVGALESLAGFLANATESEKDALSAAAKRALDDERKGPNREDWIADYSSWMEDIFGEEWEGNDRAE